MREAGVKYRTMGFLVTMLPGLQDLLSQEQVTIGCFHLIFFLPQQHELISLELLKNYFLLVFFSV